MAVRECWKTPRWRRRTGLSFRCMDELTEATQQARAAGILKRGTHFASALALFAGEATEAGGCQ